MRTSPWKLPALCAFLAFGLGSCDVSEIVGDCDIVTDHFTGQYRSSEQKSQTFQVECAGAINLFWTCPQCPDSDAGRLVLLDPLGSTAFEISGAGFAGERRQLQTILKGRWTILLQGTGGNFINNYSVDVTYPGL